MDVDASKTCLKFPRQTHRPRHWGLRQDSSCASVRKLKTAEFKRLMAIGLLLACLHFAAAAGLAASSVFTASRDTTLSENYPANNLGALKFLNAGTTQNRTRNRALIRFDLSSLPPGAQVRAASLSIEVVGEPNEPPAFSDFAVHRVLREWTEGRGLSPSNCVSCQGQGAPAQPGESTWNNRFEPEESWGQPGGDLGVDLAAPSSGSTTIYGIAGSPYEFSSTPGLIADIQHWVAHPEENFGWALVCQSEETPFTARRFGSREDPQNAPRLTLAFVAPPRLDNARQSGTEFEFSFTAFPGEEYGVEFRTSGSIGWQLLRNVEPVNETTTLIIRDPVGPGQRYYRLVTR